MNALPVLATEHEEQIHLIHPETGEALALRDATVVSLADFLEAVREWESRARQAKALASEEICRRMDQKAAWTWRDDGWEIRGESPDAAVEWDLATLSGVVKELVAEGKIDPQAADAAIRERVVREPSKRGIQALMKIPGVSGRLAEARRESARPRRVSIKRGSRA